MRTLPMPIFGRTVRSLLIAIALVVLPPATYAGYLQLSGNIHAVEVGTVYRSGQLDGHDLGALVKEKGIRSILNLRGRHPDVGWYIEEADVARHSRIEHISIGISARKEPDLITMRRIAAAIESAPKPLLIHCLAGADRTGLASAIYEYAVAGKTAEEADDQLSFAYGHFPWLWSRSGAMDQAFANFVAADEASKHVAFADRGDMW